MQDKKLPLQTFCSLICTDGREVYGNGTDAAGQSVCAHVQLWFSISLALWFVCAQQTQSDRSRAYGTLFRHDNWAKLTLHNLGQWKVSQTRVKKLYSPLKSPRLSKTSTHSQHSCLPVSHLLHFLTSAIRELLPAHAFSIDFYSLFHGIRPAHRGKTRAALFVSNDQSYSGAAKMAPVWFKSRLSGHVESHLGFQTVITGCSELQLFVLRPFPKKLRSITTDLLSQSLPQNRLSKSLFGP